MRALILGAGGQVGRALAAALPDATALTRSRFDLAGFAADALDWSSYDVVINAAAYTDVDGAETPDGRVAAWQANAAGPAALARVAREHRMTVVHLSTEYVFDGRSAEPYPEGAPIAPLSAYGASIPDGRSDTVAAGTSLPQFPACEHSTHEVVDLITARVYATVDTMRTVHDAVDAEDPGTADILHQLIDGLEKLAWLIKSENHKV